MTTGRSQDNRKHLSPPPAELSLAAPRPREIKGARSCFLLISSLLRRVPEGGGRALLKVSVGHAPRESGPSPLLGAPSLCSSAARRPLIAAGAPSSVTKTWRSPRAVCTFGCAWLQRWHLSWQDLWWVSVQTAS